MGFIDRFLAHIILCVCVCSLRAQCAAAINTKSCFDRPPRAVRNYSNARCRCRLGFRIRESLAYSEVYYQLSYTYIEGQGELGPQVRILVPHIYCLLFYSDIFCVYQIDNLWQITIMLI